MSSTRLGSTARCIGFISALVAVAVSAGATRAAAPVGHDWTRFGWNAARTSAPTFAIGITAEQVGSLTRQQVQLGGTADSSPIYLHDVTVLGATHDVFFVTTTYGLTEAIDAATGIVLWRFTPPGYTSWVGSGRITTATPVADPSRQWIYAASPNGRIYKLSVATGSSTWSVAVTKLPSREKIASSLNFAKGHVIATTGGYYGDTPPYQGHVAIISTRGRLLHVWNSLCSNRRRLIAPSTCSASRSGIWGRAGAVVDPSTGDLLVATGNAPWNGTTNWGDAVLRLSPNATQLLGNYTPTNNDELSKKDQDLGSASPFVLGSGYIGQGGKDGNIRVLSVSQMRGVSPHKGGEVQTVLAPFNGDRLYSAPAIWRHRKVTWVIATTGGIEAWRFLNGRLETVWQNNTPGTSPVVAGGLLWVFNPKGGMNVYEPTTGKLVGRLQTGEGHWNSPIVVDGRVALPEGNANDHQTFGVLDIWR